MGLAGKQGKRPWIWGLGPREWRRGDVSALKRAQGPDLEDSWVKDLGV